MANIDPYLEAIENAVYGEEVRGSIHDAISAINVESEKTEDSLSTTIAEAYDSTFAYVVGDVCTHKEDDGYTYLYECTADTSGEWDSSDWVQTTVIGWFGSYIASDNVKVYNFPTGAAPGSGIPSYSVLSYLLTNDPLTLTIILHDTTANCYYFLDTFTSASITFRYLDVVNRISKLIVVAPNRLQPTFSSDHCLLPSTSSSDEGKALVVNSSGEWEARTPSSVGEMELTQAEYDQLSQAEKMNGTTYYIRDGGAPSGTVFNMTAGANINIESAYYIEYADYYAVRIKINATGSISVGSDLLTDTPQLLSAHNVVCTVIGNNIYDMDSAVFGQVNRVFRLRTKSLVGGDSVEFSGILFK